VSDTAIVALGSGPQAVRIGVVGCGRLVERGYVPAARRAADVELAAVADPIAERCRQVAPDIKAFESVEALLAGCDVDAIVIATPPEAHLAPARVATSAGVPTLVEKPPAAGVDDALALAALPSPPWIGFNRRFLPGLRERRDELHRRVTELELEFVYPRDEWRPHTTAPDALLDAGCHLVDLARWLSGAEIRRARAVSLTSERGRVELDLGHVRATLEFAVDRPHREKIEARDVDGRRLYRRVDGGALRALARRARTPSEDNPFVNSLARQLEAIALEVRGTSGILASATDGLKVMQALAAVRASGAQGGAWESVPT
jgi:predicted dehydrogenase